MRVAVVVVTYNRLDLLKICVNQLLNQSRLPDDIIIVNNSSTDGTFEWLCTLKNIHIINQENLGGAYGFYTGLKFAMSLKVDWVWAMDDDCNPQLDALEAILNVGPDKSNIYGSVAVSQVNPEKIVWWIGDEEKKGNFIKNHNSLTPPLYHTKHTIPFLGIFVSNETISKIGYPQKELVLWNDDEEYCCRAKSQGINLYYVVKSVLMHPPVEYKAVNYFFFKSYIYKTSNFKNLYFFRNSTYVAKKYNTIFKFYLIILPKKIIKAISHSYLSSESKGKFRDFKNYLAAISDGIRGKLGPINNNAK